MQAIGVLGRGGLGGLGPPLKKYLAWQNRNEWLGRKEIDSLTEKNWKAQLSIVQKQNMASIPLFLHILPVFSQVFVWFLPYLHIFLPQQLGRTDLKNFASP